MDIKVSCTENVIPENISRIPPSTSLRWSQQSLEHQTWPSSLGVNLTKILASFSVTTKIVFSILIVSVGSNLGYQGYKYSEKQWIRSASSVISGRQFMMIEGCVGVHGDDQMLTVWPEHRGVDVGDHSLSDRSSVKYSVNVMLCVSSAGTCSAEEISNVSQTETSSPAFCWKKDQSSEKDTKGLSQAVPI